MVADARRKPPRARSDEPRPLFDRDRHRAGRRRRGDMLALPDRRPGVALLRARVGEGHGRLPDPVHTGHDARHRRGDRAGRGVDVRPIRVMATPARQPRSAPAESRSFLESLDEVSEAVESGAGLPEVARAAGRALDASVIVLDAASSVLAVACESSEDERAVMAGEGGAETVDLRVAELPVGQLRYRPRGEPPPPALLRLVANLIGLEVDRAKAPERATEAAVGDFFQDLLGRRLTDRE